MIFFFIDAEQKFVGFCRFSCDLFYHCVGEALVPALHSPVTNLPKLKPSVIYRRALLRNIKSAFLWHLILQQFLTLCFALCSLDLNSVSFHQLHSDPDHLNISTQKILSVTYFVERNYILLKFSISEKATKICKIFFMVLTFTK